MRNHPHRDERGDSLITVLIAMFLGAIIISGFVRFEIHADDASSSNARRADQESAAVQILNRVGRDISDANAVAKDEPTDLVVEHREVTGSGTSKTTTITRIRYRVVTEDGHQDLRREVDLDAVGPYSDAAWPTTPDVTTVLGRDVTDATAFTYKTATGAAPSVPSEVGRVDINYVASTEKGVVALKSSAAVDTGLGGTGGAGTPPATAPAPPPPAAPNAVDDPGYSLSAGNSVTVSVLGNDTCANGTTPCPASAATVSTASTVGGLGVTVNGSNQVVLTAPSSQPSGSVTVPYTLADANGSDTANITVNVTAAAPTSVTPAAVTFSNPCGTANDSYTVPTSTGVTYQIAGVTQSAGTYPGSGTVTVDAVAQPGYATTGTTSWTYTYTSTACPVGGSVDAYPEAAPTSTSQTTGVVVVTWDGGSLTPTRVAGSGTATLLSGTAASASSGSARYTVSLGSVWKFSAGTASDNATEFPLTPTTTAEGSDWNRDGTVDHSGVNTVDWTVDPSGTTTYTQVRAYTSAEDSLNRGYLDTYTTIDNPTQTTTTCPASAGTGGNCFADTGEVAGTEVIYETIAYTTCDFQGAKVTVGGVARCPSANYYTLGTSPLTEYTNSLPRRAYQAPSVAAASVTAGNPFGDGCTTADGLRTVKDFPDATDNGIYGCADGKSAVHYTVDPDHGQPTNAPFCDYAAADAACLGKAVNSDGTVNKGPYGAGANVVGVSQSGWSTTDTYKVYACNLGGCSAPTTTTLKSFPGAFQISGVEEPPTKREYRYNHWYKGTGPNGDCWNSNYDVSNCKKVHSDEMRVSWAKPVGLSANGGNYKFEGGYVAGPGSSTTSWSNVDTGLVENTGYLAIDAATVYQFSVKAVPSWDTSMWRRSTGASNYYYDQVFSSPLHASFIQDSPFCKQAVDNDWKYGIWFRRSVYDWGGTRRNSLGLKMRAMWWVAGKASSTMDPNLVGEWAASKWKQGDSLGSNWTGGTWNQVTGPNNGTVYYSNVTGLATDATMQQMLTGNGDTSMVLPGDGGTFMGIAHFRIESYISKEDVKLNYGLSHPVDHGDMTYWVGTGGDDNGTVDGTTQMNGVDVRVRATSVSKAANTGCGAQTYADASKYQFNGTYSGWYTVSGGDMVTRRASIGGESSAAGGANTNPNPADTNGARWAQVN